MSFFYERAYIEYKTNGHVQANSGHPGAPMVSLYFCLPFETLLIDPLLTGYGPCCPRTLHPIHEVQLQEPQVDQQGPICPF